MAVKKPLSWDQVKIIASSEIAIQPQPGVTKKLVVVTYVVEGHPPRTLWVPAEEYTRDQLLKRIQQDLEEAVRGPVLPKA